MKGVFSFDLTNTLPAIGFDQQFILKNNICKNIEIEQQEFKNNYFNNNNDDNSVQKFKWIFTCSELKCMETNLFILGQYERYKRMRYSFHPDIFFRPLQQQSFQQFNFNNYSNWMNFFN